MILALLRRHSAHFSFALLASAPVLAAAQSRPNADVRACIGALNAFERQLRAPGSRVSPDWPKAEVGALLMFSQYSRATEDSLLALVGPQSGVSRCTAAGVEPQGLQLFLLAFHGYLPSNPFDAVTECFGAFVFAAPSLDQALGAQRSEAMGMQLGMAIGRAIGQLGVLFPSEKRSADQVQARAQQVASGLSSLPPAEQRSRLRAYVAHCGTFHVPLEALLKGSGIAT
jgi:hypothetical protein